MKKTLIAAAALVAAAGAMAEITVSGTVDSTLRMSDTGDNTTTVIGRDGSGTTGLYLRGNEDLGDGLKAIALYEHDFNFTGGTGNDSLGSASDGTGERFVGLQGNFGTIKLGAPNTPSLTIQGALRGGMFGTKDGGRASAGGTGAGGLASGTFRGMFGKSLTRFGGSLVYETPNFSGFSLAVGYVPSSETGGETTSSTMDIGAFYKAGPINAGVTMYSMTDSDATVADEEESLLSLGFHYNLGFATVGFGYHAYTQAGEDVNTGLNLIGTVPLSDQLTLGVNFQTLTDDADESGDVTQIAVGVNYALSKSTSVYARYVSLDGDDLADPVTTMLAGLRFNF